MEIPRDWSGPAEMPTLLYFLKVPRKPTPPLPARLLPYLSTTIVACAVSLAALPG